MLPTEKRPRRSPRLLGKHVYSRPLEKDEKCHNKKQRPAIQGQSQPSRPARTNLLLLPDEPLCRILIDLGACKTDCTFDGPRHAFALAQTNTRLLRLFGSVLTRITPDVCNEGPCTLWPEHMLSVIRIAGQSLRELHLPESSFEDLPTVCRACPRIEVLSLINDENVTSNVLSDVMSLPLHTLSITHPSRDQLGVLTALPPDLSLLCVNYDAIDNLKPILLDPPKRLKLSIDDNVEITESMVSGLISCLGEAIPKTESADVTIPCETGGFYGFPEIAEDLIRAARENDEHSTCMSLSLDGSVLFELVTKAHRNAKIKVTQWLQTFGDDGDGVFPLVIHDRDEYLSYPCDFSRLREVSIMKMSKQQAWKEALAGVTLKEVRIRDVRYVADMWLSFESLEISISKVSGKYWNWLGDAREIYVVGPTKKFSARDRMVLMESLASLLHQFDGYKVWITYIEPFHLMLAGYDDGFAEAVNDVRAGAERFEKRGGDAGTVKIMADGIIRRWRR